MLLSVSVTGQENIQKGQSYVFVSNHQSFSDVFLVYGWLPVIFKFLMKQELRKIPFVGYACEVCGHVYIDRSSPRAAAASLRKVEETLQNGVCTVIYPEGTRTTNGEVGRFKRGAFQIALDLGLPVIPLSISGCYEIMPKGAWFVTNHPAHMHIGKPIDLKQFEEPNDAIEAVRQAVIEGIKE
jgi:1-acyl-sn-glycerol-3-phosphate acyltransferase